MGSFASLFANEPAHPVTNFANYILSNTTLSGEAGTSSQVSQSQPSSSSSSSSSSNTRSNLRPKAKYHLIKYLTILPTIYEENDEFPDTSEDEEEEDDSCGSPHDTHHY
uniref:Uncharacterized protein n=1 Tax=Panagrolaimus superbus TaxID=310955 RepID=A0A914Y599_9BILA